MADVSGRVPPAPGSHASHHAPAGHGPSGFDPSRALRSLLVAAPHHQGGHSASGRAIAEALCIPFPLTMPSLRAAAIDSGFHPYALWPWLEEMEADPAEDEREACIRILEDLRPSSDRSEWSEFTETRDYYLREAIRLIENRYRDSDEQPQAEDPKGLSGEAMPARAAEGGIAQPSAPQSSGAHK